MLGFSVTITRSTGIGGSCRMSFAFKSDSLSSIFISDTLLILSAK